MDTPSKFNILDFAAYIPCYDNGNVVKAIKRDGQTVTINRTIRTVIKNILKEQCIDFKAFREKAFEPMSRRNLAPVPFGTNGMLAPVKVRNVISSHDGAFGYVDISSIEAVDGNKNAIIKLKSGCTIKCLDSAKLVSLRIKLAHLAREQYALTMMGQFMAAKDFPFGEDKLMMLLASEVLNLEMKLEKLLSSRN